MEQVLTTQIQKTEQKADTCSLCIVAEDWLDGRQVQVSCRHPADRCRIASLISQEALRESSGNANICLFFKTASSLSSSVTFLMANCKQVVKSVKATIYT